MWLFTPEQNISVSWLKGILVWVLSGPAVWLEESNCWGSGTQAAVGKWREGDSWIILLENQGNSAPEVQDTPLDFPLSTPTAVTHKAFSCCTEEARDLTQNIFSIPCLTIALRDQESTFLVHPSFTVMYSPNERALLWYSLWWLTWITTPQDLTIKQCRPTPPRSQTTGLPFNKEHRLWSQMDPALNPGSSHY